MRIHSIRIENIGPFQVLDEVIISPLTTIIGKNDVGKSHILKALNFFFGNLKIEAQNICQTCHPNDDIVIEVSFENFPEEIEIESGITTSFEVENLLDENGLLVIKKIYSQRSLSKPKVKIITFDYQDEVIAGLPVLNESMLNDRCEQLGISTSRSGAGITNKSKRDQIREIASNRRTGKTTQELQLDAADKVWKCIKSILPSYVLFKTDTPLGVGETSFQSFFRPLVKDVSESDVVTPIREQMEVMVSEALQNEITKIHEYFTKHSDAFVRLTLKPSFTWDKIVKMDVIGIDEHGTEISLEERGSGMRRLFMVSYFEYKAEKASSDDKNIIYGIEEPENCLHPGLQRELVSSFQEIVDDGAQVILSSHSPVFAGASPKEALTLIIRNGGLALAKQHPVLSLTEVAVELGVGPSDSLFGYEVLVFVEGPDDETFFREVASKLKRAGKITQDFSDVNVGFVITGGNNLKHWVDRKVMGKLNPTFCVIIDSDKTSSTDPISPIKINWKNACESEGGDFIILRKRAIENYIHPDSLARNRILYTAYDEYTHMKDHIGRKDVWSFINQMTADEMLEMDSYQESGQNHHELKEIVERILSLIP